MERNLKELKGRLIALDAESSRHFDDNGYLHVSGNRLTCDQVAGYFGFELPPHEGIEPDKVYYAYRPAEELQKALDTYNGVPLLEQHEFDSPDQPLKELRVGAVGTDAQWVDPFVTNDLTIWDKTAIDKVLNGELAELSCGYTFEPDWKSGQTSDGVSYDLVMRNIKCNHVALVRKGRATGCKVADTLPNQSMEKSAMEENKSACDDFTEWSRKVIESAGVELTPEQKDALVRAFAEAHAKFQEERAEEAKEDIEGTREDADEPKAEEAKAEQPEAVPAEEKPAEDKADAAPEEGCKDKAETGDEDVIAKAVDAAKAHVAALFTAAEEIRGVAGKVKALDFDTPAAIYQVGLKALGAKAVSDAAAAEVFRALAALKKSHAESVERNDDALTARLNSL